MGDRLLKTNAVTRGLRRTVEERFGAREELDQVRLGDLLASLVEVDPPDGRVRRLGARLLGARGGEHVPDVDVLVSGLAATGRHVDDDDLHRQTREDRREWREVAEAG